MAGVLKQLKRTHKKVPICPYEISKFYLKYEILTGSLDFSALSQHGISSFSFLSG